MLYLNVYTKHGLQNLLNHRPDTTLHSEAIKNYHHAKIQELACSPGEWRSKLGTILHLETTSKIHARGYGKSPFHRWRVRSIHSEKKHGKLRIQLYLFSQLCRCQKTMPCLQIDVQACEQLCYRTNSLPQRQNKANKPLLMQLFAFSFLKKKGREYNMVVIRD